MSDEQPTFRYHPNPVASGVAKNEAFVCACCGQQRTWRYSGPMFGWNTAPVEDRLCFHCIADGTAALRFEVEFSDAHPLMKAKLASAIVDEVTKRTPGYLSWQQDRWLSHCDDACVYLGDATARDVETASEDTVRACQAEHALSVEAWNDFAGAYARGRGAAIFYKFQCRHCDVVRLGFDLE